MNKRLLMGLWCLLLAGPLIFLGPGVPRAADSTEAVTANSSDSTPAETIAPSQPTTRPLVYTMTIDGAITVVTADLIAGAVEKAEDHGAALLIFELDTPGGYTAATWDIIKSLLNSHVPVCVYIYPPGARAGSAGVYMTYAANFAAMAPSTNIGAAHPVAGGGEQIDSVMNEKITNDAVAQIKAAAVERGRNAEWAEKAVRESVSITDREALDMNVINVRAESVDDLLSKLNGKETKTPSGNIVMALTDAKVEEIHTSFLDRFLEVITDPNIVFVLFSIGTLGIAVELWNPGSILPGVVGAISLILAFYASSVLPVSYAAIGLILLAIVLFIAEIKITSHGLLTIGGLISLFLGGMMLIRTSNPALQVSKAVLFTVTGLVGVSLGIIIFLVVRVSRKRVFIGNDSLIGKIAVVKPTGLVYVEGALWKADSDEELQVGAKVEVIEVHDLTLKVRPINH